MALYLRNLTLYKIVGVLQNSPRLVLEGVSGAVFTVSGAVFIKRVLFVA